MTIVYLRGAEAEDDLPDPDVLAYRLVARESPLDRAVLHELIGRPKRYGDLKPLLGDKGDHNLTVCLRRLQEWGLIERRTDARQEPAVHAYELTPLGIQTVLAIQTIKPLHESLGIYESARRRAAEESGLRPGLPIDPEMILGKAVVDQKGESLGEIVEVGLYDIGRVRFLLVEDPTARRPIRRIGVEDIEKVGAETVEVGPDTVPADTPRGAV